MKIDGFKIYKKNSTSGEYEVAYTAASNLREYDIPRDMAAGQYGVTAYKTVASVLDPEKTVIKESDMSYFTVDPFYKVTVTTLDSYAGSVTVHWTNETNVNFIDGYYVYKVTDDGYTLLQTLENTATECDIERDDTDMKIVISPITYESFHDADSSNVQVALIYIPAPSLSDPTQAVSYTANWAYIGDAGFTFDPDDKIIDDSGASDERKLSDNAVYYGMTGYVLGIDESLGKIIMYFANRTDDEVYEIGLIDNTYIIDSSKDGNITAHDKNDSSTTAAFEVSDSGYMFIIQTTAGTSPFSCELLSYVPALLTITQNNQAGTYYYASSYTGIGIDYTNKTVTLYNDTDFSTVYASSTIENIYENYVVTGPFTAMGNMTMVLEAYNEMCSVRGYINGALAMDMGLFMFSKMIN